MTSSVHQTVSLKSNNCARGQNQDHGNSPVNVRSLTKFHYNLILNSLSPQNFLNGINYWT